MPTLTRIFRMLAGALVLMCVVAMAAPASAQVRNPDGSVNPSASAVQERQLLQELQKVQGRVSIPDQKCRRSDPACRPELASLP